MKLGARNNKVVWLKSDGTLSQVPASGKSILRLCGFSIPQGPGGGVCISAKIICGDPFKNEAVIVKAQGNSWWGDYVVFKGSSDYVRLEDGQAEVIKGFVERKLTAGAIRLYLALAYPKPS